LAPPKLAPRLQSLPPILHKLIQISLPSCSKGAQGLSVLSRVTSICAGDSISLRPLLRQCGNRYAIRAGRNLPDKEFRYLRTVRYHCYFSSFPERRSHFCFALHIAMKVGLYLHNHFWLLKFVFGI